LLWPIRLWMVEWMQNTGGDAFKEFFLVPSKWLCFFSGWHPHEVYAKNLSFVFCLVFYFG
jgi:hypothetical protein